MDFNWIYKPVTLTGNLDEKYFVPTGEEGQYKYSPMLIKIIAEDAAAYFKQKVLELDTNDEFSSMKVRQVEDEDATKKAKEPYKEAYKKLDERWDKYRSSHMSEFVQEITADGSIKAEAHRILSGFIPDVSISSARDALAAYKAANELAKKYGKGGEEYDSLPTFVRYVSHPDYVDTHNAVRAKWRQSLGLPEKDSDLVVKVESEMRVLFNANNKIIKAVDADDEYVEDFANDLVHYLSKSY